MYVAGIAKSGDHALARLEVGAVCIDIDTEKTGEVKWISRF